MPTKKTETEKVDAKKDAVKKALVPVLSKEQKREAKAAAHLADLAKIVHMDKAGLDAQADKLRTVASVYGQQTDTVNAVLAAIVDAEGKPAKKIKPDVRAAYIGLFRARLTKGEWDKVSATGLLTRCVKAMGFPIVKHASNGPKDKPATGSPAETLKADIMALLKGGMMAAAVRNMVERIITDAAKK